jgi:hypothetical protein
MRAPIFAEYFTDDVTVVITLSGRPNSVLPVHNDYLSAGLGGGLVGAALLVAIVMFGNGVALRALGVVRRRSIERRAILALQGSMNAAAAIAFANPVFMNPVSSTIAYVLVAALSSMSSTVLDQKRSWSGEEREQSVGRGAGAQYAEFVAVGAGRAREAGTAAVGPAPVNVAGSNRRDV